MKELMKKFYEEEITKEQFIAEASKEINDEKFVTWLADCIEFGSIEDDYEGAVKSYNREAEINKTAKFLANNDIEVSDSIKVIEKKIAEKSVIRKEVVKKSYNKSEVFKRAWQIAREAAHKFSGKVKEFFSESLKAAWAEAKCVS